MTRFETTPKESRQSQNFGNFVQQARKAKGYSWEELAVATGLTIDEIRDIEINVDEDGGRLQRVASVLQIKIT